MYLMKCIILVRFSVWDLLTIRLLAASALLNGGLHPVLTIIQDADHRHFG